MNVVEIVFSPTGGTQKVAQIISEQWNGEAKRIDLSDHQKDFSKCRIEKQDMVLIAMPSYGGRAPAVAIERLKQIDGNNAKCTLVCVYGNRAYEDTLVEMKDAARESGFRVIAAVAAVAEHSIMPQYAKSRPDASDRKQLMDFASKITDDSNSNVVINKEENVVAIPGNRPYKKAGGAGLVPKQDKSCTKCGLCAKNCPVCAISEADYRADSKKCISCMRCMKQCPINARKVNGVMVSVAAMAIKKACLTRKENELFL